MRRGNVNTIATKSVTSLRTDAGMTNTKPDTSGTDFTTLPSGVKIKDIVVGTGTAVAAHETVTIFYTGWRDNDGFMFDQNRHVGSPSVFPLDNLIQGFQIGAEGMKPGGIRQVFIPSSLGYDPSGGATNIPVGTNLVFEIKLLARTA